MLMHMQLGRSMNVLQARIHVVPMKLVMDDPVKKLSWLQNCSTSLFYSASKIDMYTDLVVVMIIMNSLSSKHYRKLKIFIISVERFADRPV